MTFRRSFRAAILVSAVSAALALIAAPGAGAATLPEKFEAQTVFSGLSQPVNFVFGPKGEAFVAEKNGKIEYYESLQSTEPTLFANLAEPVYDFEDHGLLGLALDPRFGEAGHDYVYALYTYNHKLANKETQQPQVTDPRAETLAWPEYKGPGKYENDKCPEGEEVAAKKKKGEQATEKLGCEVSGLLVRLTAEGHHAAPSAEAPAEKVLLEGWCQQSTTHSIGDLGFGPEGALFVSGGEGAMFSEPDFGQFGNLCEDPPENAKEPEGRPLNSLGGSLRSQSVLRNHSEPRHRTLLSGTLLRINPETGEGWPGNPFGTSLEANARRIYGFGFRQPWRFAFNDRTGNIFLDNVGNGHYEEMDRIPLDESHAYNSGWPCYEGGSGQVNARNYEYAGEGGPSSWFDVCKTFYENETAGKTEAEAGYPLPHAPFFAYEHSGPVVPGDPCLGNITDIAGISFYEGTTYPRSYHDSLFFADAIRGCIYMMKAAANGEPDPSTATAFLSGVPKFSFPGLAIQQGPEGNIFFAEYGEKGAGAIKRIVYTGTSQKDEEQQKEREEQEEREKAQREQKEKEEREKAEREKPPAVNPPTPVTPVPVPTPAPAPVIPKPPKIEKRPAKTTTQRTAKFVFSDQAGVRFFCKIDGRAFASCRSPRTYKNLKPGEHTVRIYAQSTEARSYATVFSWKIVTN